MEEQADRYLAPTATIDCNHPSIARIVGRVGGDSSDVYELASKLFAWARDEIAYDVESPFFLPEHYRASFVVERGRGFCIQKAVVLAAFCRRARIPARLVFADIRNHRAPRELVEMMGTDVFAHHCYNELWLGGRWVKVVCSFDKRLCERHDFPLVEFDGRHDALFPDRDAAQRPFVEYVKVHGPRDDVDVGEVLEAWEKTYGRYRVQEWKRVLSERLGE